MTKYKVVEIKINWLMGSSKTDIIEEEINKNAEQGYKFMSSEALNFNGLTSKVLLFFQREE